MAVNRCNSEAANVTSPEGSQMINDDKDDYGKSFILESKDFFLNINFLF